MDFVSISAAITSTKTALDILKTLSKISKEQRFTDYISDLQRTIFSLNSELLSIQQEQSELIQIKNKLEKKLMEYENWKNIKSQYELYHPIPDISVYSIKENNIFSEPPHWLCQTCIDNRHNKSILQLMDTIEGYKIYKCFECKNEIKIYTGENIPPDETSNPDNFDDPY